jgi:hypothetical protein
MQTSHLQLHPGMPSMQNSLLNLHPGMPSMHASHLALAVHYRLPSKCKLYVPSTVKV